MLMSLHSACWKSAQTDSGTATSELDDWLRQFGSLPHVHIGCIKILDVYSVAQIDATFSGVWRLMDNSLFINSENASTSFNALKRETRRLFKAASRGGLLFLHNSCSDIKIAHSFNHLIDNQGIVLYNPNVDVLPQY